MSSTIDKPAERWAILRPCIGSKHFLKVHRLLPTAVPIKGSLTLVTTYDATTQVSYSRFNPNLLENLLPVGRSKSLFTPYELVEKIETRSLRLEVSGL